MQTQQDTKTIDMVTEPRAAALPAVRKPRKPAGAASPEPASAAPTPADMVRYVMSNGGSIEQLREFMQLQREMEAEEARRAYVAAMVEFKKNPPVVVKDKKNGFINRDGEFVGYTSATIGNLTMAIIQKLAEHGFSHEFKFSQPDGMVRVTCVITHKQGHSESNGLESAPDETGKKGDIQRIGSAVTYLERYTLQGSTGIAIMDDHDDDGAAAGTIEKPDADQWCAKAMAAPAGRDLQAVWEAGKPKFDAANDTDGLVKFTAACEARKDQIMAAKAANGNKSNRLRDIVQPGQQEGAA